jgi:GNAT superfamily N-acetyltransferase
MTLRREDAEGAGPRWVVARAEAELTDRYGGLDDSELGLTPQMFDPPEGAFVVGRGPGTGTPAGGVGVRRVGPVLGEVKRLWVDPPWRGRGLGRALMDALEEEARRLGLVALQLGTGDRQPEAIALYQSTGWVRELLDDDGRPLPPGHYRFSKRLD